MIIGTHLTKNKKKNKKNNKIKNKIKNKKNKKKDKKPFDPEETIKWMFDKEDAHVNNELFRKHFKVEKLSLMYEVLRKTNDKKENSE